MTLRVGQLEFVNALPFYGALERVQVGTPFELVKGYPAQLNKKLSEGDLDLSLVSSFEYLRNSDKYDLLPGYCQASDREVRSVTLHYKGELKDLTGKDLALTQQSATSAQLVKLLCQNFWHIEPNFVPLPDLESVWNYPAFLLIGDNALLHPGFPDYNRIDLATAWNEKTHLPMTFAVFAVRKEVMAERKDEVEGFCKQLEASLAWAESNQDAICQMGVETSPLPLHILSDYYPRLRFRMALPELQALRAFAVVSGVEVPKQLEALCNPKP